MRGLDDASLTTFRRSTRKDSKRASSTLAVSRSLRSRSTSLRASRPHARHAGAELHAHSSATLHCGHERTRTSTGLPPLRPERSASTNSATCPSISLYYATISISTSHVRQHLRYTDKCVWSKRAQCRTSTYIAPPSRGGMLSIAVLSNTDLCI